jgi:hypothetical protein
MVGLAQGGHHLTLNELPTAMAACPVHSLVVQGAEILSVLYEEAPLGQVTATHFAGKTLDVEMFGLDPKHFPLAWLPTFMAVNDGLLCWVVRVLRVGHHPSKAGCDFLGILAQAPIWAGLLWKACFVHHCKQLPFFL